MSNTKLEQKNEFEALGELHKDTVARIKLRMEKEEERLSIQVQNENERVTKLKDELQNELHQEEDRLSVELQTMKDSFENELKTEKRMTQEFEKSCEQELEALDFRIKQMRKNHSKEAKDIADAYESKIKEVMNKTTKLEQEMKDLRANHTRQVNAIEEQADMELIREQQVHEVATFQEMKSSVRLKKEIDITKKKYDALMKDSEEHKESIIYLQEKQSEIATTIEMFKKEKATNEDTTRTQDDTIIKLGSEISSLAEETRKMER